MTVFLAVATGEIGQRLVPLLVARGHEVTATTRSAGKVTMLKTMGAEPVVVDGLDAVGIGEAVARAQPEAIIHQMTSITGSPDLKHFDKWFRATNALRTKGTEHLLAAASAVGVERFIAQSFTGWPNIREGGLIKSEADPLDPNPARAQTE